MLYNINIQLTGEGLQTNVTPTTYAGLRNLSARNLPFCNYISHKVTNFITL